MSEELKPSNENLPEEGGDKNTPDPGSLKRKEALKRMAYLAVGGITGAFLFGSTSCEPYSDYSDYSDYSNYSDYSDYYSDSYYYYDYYSVYSAYWDA